MLIRRTAAASDGDDNADVHLAHVAAADDDDNAALNDARLWQYVAEGACSVVVRHAHNGTVLRLNKHVVAAPAKRLLHTRSAFLTRVQRLLPRYALVGRVVHLSSLFVEAVDAAMAPHRPHARRHVGLAAHLPATLLPDMTAAGPRPHAPVLCVELKPKWCFLPDAAAVDAPIKSRVCRFCMHQRLKLARGDIERVSEFCPIALSSADPARVRAAVDALLRTPQNNLRLFFDGQPLGAVDGGEIAQQLVDERDGSLLPAVARAVDDALGDGGDARRRLCDVVACVLIESAVLQDIGAVQQLGGGDVSAVMRRRDDAELLEQFMTGSVFKDCSVMLSLCRAGDAALPAGFGALQRLAGLAARVAIVDVEQKSVADVERYAQLDREIVACAEKSELTLHSCRDSDSQR